MERKRLWERIRTPATTLQTHSKEHVTDTLLWCLWQRAVCLHEGPRNIPTTGGNTRHCVQLL